MRWRRGTACGVAWRLLVMRVVVNPHCSFYLQLHEAAEFTDENSKRCPKTVELLRSAIPKYAGPPPHAHISTEILALKEQCTGMEAVPGRAIPSAGLTVGVFHHPLPKSTPSLRAQLSPERRTEAYHADFLRIWHA